MYTLNILRWFHTRRTHMKTKAHLVFPLNVLEEVDQIAGKRKRSLFIVKATEEKLERERFLKALNETGGAWSDKHHAGLRTARGMEQYLREKRSSYRKRLRRISNE
jgi:hypothetical protein